MKLLALLKCSVLLTAGILLSRFDSAQPTISPEYRVGGFVLGCQAYTFHRFTAFEAIEKTAAAGGKAIEFYPGQSLSPDDKKTKVDFNASDELGSVAWPARASRLQCRAESGSLA
jgi:hypothetical protein